MLSLLEISLYVANILQRIIKRTWEQYLDFSFCHDRPFVISSLMVDLSLVDFFSRKPFVVLMLHTKIYSKSGKPRM